MEKSAVLATGGTNVFPRHHTPRQYQDGRLVGRGYNTLLHGTHEIMNPSIRLILLLHNHQPVGNFDGVFEQAYRDSYAPFLDVFEPYTDLKIALHTSGPLMEWLDVHHPEYLDRLAALVEAQRIEIVGGAYYEPILTMIPPRDRNGQITEYTRWLERRLGGRVQGMWIAERVWEQSLAADLSRAGMDYTVLDDFHFKNAGVPEEQLFGYYVTEEDGRTIAVFPGSERLRYLIPFAEPQATIDYLRNIAERHEDAVVLFGDDGEKFGTWPDTKQHVYDNEWLRNFFDTLVQNQSWLQVTTPAETFHNTAPQGQIYLPEGSYREMTEWALPTERQLEYEAIQHELEQTPHWPRVSSFVRGGFWRNFKVKYPESNEMYVRMMMVSQRLAAVMGDNRDVDFVESARRELYRAQCNCSYWHGAFGGIYLPHLRNAVYNHLIAADNLLDQATGKSGAWVDATAEDYDFDTRQEVCLANDRLIAFLAPARGGQLYELDVRSICHNLLATLARRCEPYHSKVLQGASQHNDEAASIHDRVVFKQEGLEKKLQYDRAPRKSLLDYFLDDDVSLEQVARGELEDRGDFAGHTYEARVQRNPDRIRVQLTRTAMAFDFPLTITKGIALTAGSEVVEIAYMLEGLPQNRDLHFAVELNLAGLPPQADDRYFFRGDQRLGHLGTVLDLEKGSSIGLADEWMGMRVNLEANRPTPFWTFPVETVSQSEGGFEAVHQSVVVMPHWRVRGDEQGRWTTTMNLVVDTSQAEARSLDSAEAVVS